MPAIIYGAAARNFRPVDTKNGQANPDCDLGGPGLFLDNLCFNREVSNEALYASTTLTGIQEIELIASVFGPLESVSERAYPDPDEMQTNSFDIDFIHSGLRCEGMDKHIWEIKWRHRDDCVTALMV